MPQLNQVAGLEITQFILGHQRQQNTHQYAHLNPDIYAEYLKLEQVPYVETLPFYDVLKCRQEYNTQANALSKQQVKSIFNAIDRDTFLSVRDYAVYAMMYKLGLRVSEVHQLNLENIDFDGKKITVGLIVNKRRALHPDEEMIAILTQWIAVRKHFLNDDISNALFLSKKGNRLAIRTMEDNFKKILKKLNLTF